MRDIRDIRDMNRRNQEAQEILNRHAEADKLKQGAQPQAAKPQAK